MQLWRRLAYKYLYSNRVMVVLRLKGPKVDHKISVIEDGFKEWNFCEYVDIVFVIVTVHLGGNF
jgi:hypothetical protein